MTYPDEMMVRSSFTEVLETFGFMFADMPEADTPLPPPDGAVLRVHEAFTGEIGKGEVRLWASIDFGVEMATNVLGVDAMDAASAAVYGADTLKELVNVLSTRIATNLFGTQAVFDFTIPEAEEGSAAPWQEWLKTPGLLPFLVEGHVVLVQVSVDGTAP